jgi:hypothetical protein
MVDIEKAEGSGRSIWIWNAIGLLGIVLVAACSILIVNSAAQRTAEETAKAIKAQNDAKTYTQQIEAAKTEAKQVHTQLLAEKEALAKVKDDLEKSKAQLEVSNSHLKSIAVQAATSGSISSADVDRSLDSQITKTNEEPTAICYIKFNGDREGRALAGRIHQILSEHQWVSQIAPATYRGPSKHGDFVAQVRFSDLSDAPFANKIADAMRQNNLPTKVEHIPEPGGQKGILRLWVLQ